MGIGLSSSLVRGCDTEGLRPWAGRGCPTACLGQLSLQRPIMTPTLEQAGIDTVSRHLERVLFTSRRSGKWNWEVLTRLSKEVPILHSPMSDHLCPPSSSGWCLKAQSSQQPPGTRKVRGLWSFCACLLFEKFSPNPLPWFVYCLFYLQTQSFLPGKRSKKLWHLCCTLVTAPHGDPWSTCQHPSLLPQAWHFWVLRSQLKLSFFRQVELKCCVHNLSLPVLSSSQMLGPPESRFLSYCFVFLFPRMGASSVLRHGLYRTLNLTAPQRLERRFTWLLPWLGGVGSAGKSNPNEFFKILSHHISKIFKQHPLIHFASFLCFLHLPFFLTFQWQF